MKRANPQLERTTSEPTLRDGEALLTVPEVAALLRLTEKGIYAMVSARRIPFLKVSNRVRFLRADVLAWLSENRVPASEKDR